MEPREAGKQITAQVAVAREDIARAKGYILKCDDTNTESLVDQWFSHGMDAGSWLQDITWCRGYPGS